MSMPRLLWLASCVAAVAGSATPAAAADCAGNACSVISISWTGTCYNVRNTDASKRVEVELNTGAIKVSKELGAGESWTPVALGGRCIGSIVHPYRATYK